MGRKAKDPEIRKKELILASEKLFKEKGFEDTSVSDITDAVGVSHGTFFYYFDSKKDILKAVTDYYLNLNVEWVRGVLNDKKMGAIKKAQIIIDASCRPAREQELENKMTEYMHRKGNEALHSEYKRSSEAAMIPLLTKLVEQGVAEGVFDVKYPRETVAFILPLLTESLHELNYSASKDDYYCKIRAMEILLTRVLGIKEGSLSLLSQ